MLGWVAVLAVIATTVYGVATTAHDVGGADGAGSRHVQGKATTDDVGGADGAGSSSSGARTSSLSARCNFTAGADYSTTDGATVAANSEDGCCQACLNAPTCECSCTLK
jgi:hypothetical protein